MRRTLLPLSLLCLLAFATQGYAQETPAEPAAAEQEAAEEGDQEQSPAAADEGAAETAKDSDEAKEDQAQQADKADEQEADKELPLPKRLKREGKEAQDARKAAMQALSQEHPGKQALAAQDGAAAPIQTRPIVPSPQGSELLPWLEHHGFFRFRADFFYNLDLDTHGSSPIPPPLESEQRGEDYQEHINPTDDEVLAGANITFRYTPTMHITEDLRVHAVFDILSNLVLGTTPSPGAEIGALSFDGSTTPSLSNIGEESLLVRAAWAEVDTLIGYLAVGRMPAHWGLGLVENNGGVFSATQQALGEAAWTCVDCDHGDFIDRVSLITREPFYRLFYLGFTWDYFDQGAAAYDSADTFGQAYDLSPSDDVLQLTFSIFDEPRSRKEIDERIRANEKLEIALDWGARFTYREQDLAQVDPEAIDYDGASTNPLLFSADATIYMIDAWFKTSKRFSGSRAFSLAAEAVTTFIEVGATQVDDEEDHDQVLFGGALEAIGQFSDLYIGFNGGVAGGTKIDYSGAIAANSGMRFDSAYQLDLIMFNELMGGVNNSVYFNPWIAYHFPLQQLAGGSTVGARFDILSALALEKEATPGEEYWYGLEGDLSVFYEESDRYRFEIATGLFLPGAAWTRRAGGDYPILPSSDVYPDYRSIEKDYEGELAYTLQGNMFWMF